MQGQLNIYQNTNEKSQIKTKQNTHYCSNYRVFSTMPLMLIVPF